MEKILFRFSIPTAFISPTDKYLAHQSNRNVRAHLHVKVHIRVYVTSIRKLCANERAWVCMCVHMLPRLTPICICVYIYVNTTDLLVSTLGRREKIRASVKCFHLISRLLFYCQQQFRQMICQ